MSELYRDILGYDQVLTLWFSSCTQTNGSACKFLYKASILAGGAGSSGVYENKWKTIKAFFLTRFVRGIFVK
ncbi:MAG: hypothetical protein QM669_06415 [Siphonobacter sp.]